MPIFEPSTPGLNEFHLDFDGWPHLADLVIAVDRNGVLNIEPRSGSEYRSRRQLAFYGFKPDRNFARTGYPLSMRISRVSDLEDVAEMRGTFLVPDSRITTHVTPYVFATITHPGGDLDLNVLGYTASGLMLPFPWPRVLNCYRLVRVSTGTIVFPRGPISGSDRGRHDTIGDAGTMVFPARMDSAMSENGLIESLVADDYDLEIGHVEPIPTQSVLGASIPFGPERWSSSATP